MLANIVGTALCRGTTVLVLSPTQGTRSYLTDTIKDVVKCIRLQGTTVAVPSPTPEVSAYMADATSHAGTNDAEQGAMHVITKASDIPESLPDSFMVAIDEYVFIPCSLLIEIAKLRGGSVVGFTTPVKGEEAHLAQMEALLCAGGIDSETTA